MTLSIRLLHDADLAIADTIVVAAYNALSSRKVELQNYMRLQPDGWMLALLDDRPVGLGGLVNYGAFAYLGMMCTLPEVQGKGIGKGLMKQLMAWADARKCPAILLDASEAGFPLYKQFGFVEESKTAQWRWNTIEKAHQETPSGLCAAGNVMRMQANDLPALLALDIPCFGAQRARVLENMLSRYLQRAFVVRNDEGQVSGYLFAQERSIGPWVARTARDAECLLAWALTLPFSEGAASVNISSENSEGEALLERNGFVRQRILSHMLRGRKVERAMQNIYGQASFALG